MRINALLKPYNNVLSMRIFAIGTYITIIFYRGGGYKDFIRHIPSIQYTYIYSYYYIHVALCIQFGTWWGYEPYISPHVYTVPDLGGGQ